MSVLIRIGAAIALAGALAFAAHAGMFGSVTPISGGTVTRPPTPPTPPGTVCNNPAAPRQAALAGFNTLAYCRDFTQTTSASQFLDCAGASNPEWGTFDGVGIGSPCSNRSIQNDPLVNQNAFVLLAQPSDGNKGTTDIITTGSGQYFMLFPLTNMYLEIKYRINFTEYAAVNPCLGSPCNYLMFDLFTNFTDGSHGHLQLDDLEINSGSANPTAYFGGIIDWATGALGVTNNTSFNNNTYTDSNYHIVSSLRTANRSTNQVGICEYFDGTGIKCNTPSNTQSAANVSQQGILQVWNGVNNPIAQTGTMHVYLAYVRVWSCAGWSSVGPQPSPGGIPVSVTNTCNSSTVYTGTPP